MDIWQIASVFDPIRICQKSSANAPEKASILTAHRFRLSSWNEVDNLWTSHTPFLGSQKPIYKAPFLHHWDYTIDYLWSTGSLRRAVEVSFFIPIFPKKTKTCSDKRHLFMYLLCHRIMRIQQTGSFRLSRTWTPAISKRWTCPFPNRRSSKTKFRGWKCLTFKQDYDAL